MKISHGYVDFGVYCYSRYFNVCIYKTFFSSINHSNNVVCLEGVTRMAFDALDALMSIKNFSVPKRIDIVSGRVTECFLSAGYYMLSTFVGFPKFSALPEIHYK